jgi:hypothetical protein
MVSFKEQIREQRNRLKKTIVENRCAKNDMLLLIEQQLKKLKKTDPVSRRIEINPFLEALNARRKQIIGEETT